MGTLPPSPRRSARQSPATLPSGSDIVAFYGTLPSSPRRSAGQIPATLPSGSDIVAFLWGFAPNPLLEKQQCGFS